MFSWVMLKMRVLNDGGTNLHIMQNAQGILAQSISNYFYRIPWSWKNRLCHFIQKIQSFFAWVTLKKWVLHNGATNLHITGILPLTLSTSYCFCHIYRPWKHRFCHLIGQIWSCINWVMPETEFRIMAELICILWAKYSWLNQFLIAFIVFLDHENIGFVTLFVRFGHVLAKLCLKNEFCIMA